MKNVRYPNITGVVQDVGKAQGYEPLSIYYRICLEHNPKRGVPQQVRCAEMRYKPDKAELEKLNQGGSIQLTLLIGDNAVQPHRLEIIE